MELLVIVCSSTLRSTLLNHFERNGINSYTLVPEVFGSGKGGGTRLNDEIWPGANALFLVALDEDQSEPLKEWARQYRLDEVREGLKIFSLALKEIV